MKTRLVVAILVSPVLALTTSSAHAEEPLDRYTYNENGTYSKAGSDDADADKSSDNGGSAGRLEVKGGYAKGFDLDANSTNWSLRGSHASRFSNNLNVQLDGIFQYWDSDLGDQSKYDAAIHIAYHEPDDYAFGVFGQIGLLDNDGLSDSATDSNFGVEAASFLEDATLYGRAGLNNLNINGFDFNSVFFQAGVRYFVSDNIRLDFDARLDESMTQITAAGNYRLQNSPVSVFAGYTYENIDAGYFGDFDSGMIFAGLRLHLNSDSLRDEERNGLIWSTIN